MNIEARKRAVASLLDEKNAHVDEAFRSYVETGDNSALTRCQQAHTDAHALSDILHRLNELPAPGQRGASRPSVMGMTKAEHEAARKRREKVQAEQEEAEARRRQTVKRFKKKHGRAPYGLWELDEFKDKHDVSP